MNDTMQRVARLRAMIHRLREDPDVHGPSIDVAEVALQQVLTRLRIEYWRKRDGVSDLPPPDPKKGWVITRDPKEPSYPWKITHNGEYYDHYRQLGPAQHLVSRRLAD
jgi:hypothetical protein